MFYHYYINNNNDHGHDNDSDDDNDNDNDNNNQWSQNLQWSQQINQISLRETVCLALFAESIETSVTAQWHQKTLLFVPN